MRLGADGTVTVTVGSVPQGQSHETIAAQVVAQELGISESHVMVAQGFDTERATPIRAIPAPMRASSL